VFPRSLPSFFFFSFPSPGTELPSALLPSHFSSPRSGSSYYKEAIHYRGDIPGGKGYEEVWRVASSIFAQNPRLFPEHLWLDESKFRWAYCQTASRFFVFATDEEGAMPGNCLLPQVSEERRGRRGVSGCRGVGADWEDLQVLYQ
jgi:hypothetical protein